MLKPTSLRISIVTAVVSLTLLALGGRTQPLSASSRSELLPCYDAYVIVSPVDCVDGCPYGDRCPCLDCHN